MKTLDYTFTRTSKGRLRLRLEPVELPQPEALQLAGRGLRQLVDEDHSTGVLVRRDGLLDEGLQRLRQGVVTDQPRARDDEGGEDLAPRLVGEPHDSALHDVGMGEQGFLDLRAGDVVARGHDHVVAPGAVPEVAVLVLDEGVAGDVPAVLDVGGLPRVVEVAAAGGALDGQPTRLPGRQLATLRVQDRGPEARYWSAGRAGPDLVVRGTDEDGQQLGGPDAVDQAQRGGVMDRLAGGRGGMLPRRHGAPQ